MNKDGKYKTKYMVSLEQLQKLKTNCVFINASRGGVVNNNDLAEVLKIRKDLKVWLDVFEGEPSIDNHELLSLVDGATAHIAGYSYESKRRANVMLAHSMAKALNRGKIGAMDYYRLQNIVADTNMRNSFTSNKDKPKGRGDFDV